MKHTKLIFSLLLISFLSISSVFAQNTHFIGSPSISDNGTTLTYCAKLAGLGNNQSVTVILSASATVTTTCTNPGGNVAPGQTKTVSVSASGTFTSDKNGTVTFCLTTLTPEPGSCPNGMWSGTVTDVSFTNTRILVDGKAVN